MRALFLSVWGEAAQFGVGRPSEHPGAVGGFLQGSQQNCERFSLLLRLNRDGGLLRSAVGAAAETEKKKATARKKFERNGACPLDFPSQDFVKRDEW